MDYSKPEGQKSPPTFAGTTIIPPRDDHPPPLPTPPARRGHDGAPGHWNTGLFECFSDIPNCCVTFWCPCVTFGQVAEIIDRGSTSCGASGALYALIAVLTGWSCLYSCFYRSKMRRQYGLPESPLPDVLVHCCCEMCALCQEYRELKERGFDMTIGWDGNAEKQNQGLTMAPVVEQGMTR